MAESIFNYNLLLEYLSYKKYGKWEDFKKYTLEFLKGVLPFETYKTTLLYLHLKGKELNNENNKTKRKSTII